MNLRPWEFYKMTFEEFITASKGFRAGDIELMKKFRIVAWSANFAFASKTPPSPEQWMPLDDDARSDMTREKFLAIKEQMFSKGILRRKPEQEN